MSHQNNPLLNRVGLPAFKQIQASHVEPAIQEVLDDCLTRLLEVESRKISTWDDLVPPLDEISDRIQRSWGPVTHLVNVMNTPELRAAHLSMQPKMVEFGLRLRQSRPIYEAFTRLKQSPNFSALSPARQRTIDLSIRDAELSGIKLQDAKQLRFQEIEKELSAISVKYSNNVLDSSKAFYLDIEQAGDIDGVPEDARQLAAANYSKVKNAPATAQNGPWRITLDMPCYTAVMQHAKSRKLREKVYRAYMTRASVGEFDNSDTIVKILELRQEKARLLGFKNFAELSLAQKMAPNVQAVFDLLEKLRIASFTQSKKEYQEIQDFAVANGITGELKLWDVSFWSERLREKRFNFTEEELKPYFALPNVLTGLFSLVETIFGIVVKPSKQVADVWHPDVQFFEIFNQTNLTIPIAGFFLDPYSRPETKKGGAWMDDALPRCIIRGKSQIPVAYLVCNSTPPSGDGNPSLMTFSEVETLFHEFGHGLQHMLTKIDELSVSGINGIEWDAVELASQFMENWCYHHATISKLAKHYKTGEALPKTLFDNLRNAKNFMSASMMLRQLRFAILDMELHSNFDPSGTESIAQVADRVAAKASIIPPLPEDRSLCAFTHIFAGGYAAGYYSYKWAEVLSADAFSAFEDGPGVDSETHVKQTGDRYRRTILELGGSIHPMEVFQQFRGRAPEPHALLRHSGLSE